MNPIMNIFQSIIVPVTSCGWHKSGRVPISGASKTGRTFYASNRTRPPREGLFVTVQKYCYLQSFKELYVVHRQWRSCGYARQAGWAILLQG